MIADTPTSCDITMYAIKHIFAPYIHKICLTVPMLPVLDSTGAHSGHNNNNNKRTEVLFFFFFGNTQSEKHESLEHL